MSEPYKMFSVIMPFKTFEKLKTVAKEHDISVGKTIRIAVDSFLKNIKGKVMITHYQNGLYDELYRDWQRYEYQSFKGSRKSDGEAKPKTTEVLFCNFKPEVRTRNLFEGVQP